MTAVRKASFHVDEMEKWQMALGNVKNLLEYFDRHGEAFAVEVLANGPAVRGYHRNEGSELRAGMQALSERGVVFAACNNALNTQKMTPGDLMEFVTVVPAGVAELLRLQEDGYGYLKP